MKTLNNEEEYRIALARLEEIFNYDGPDATIHQEVDHLSIVIGQYEDLHYSIEKPAPEELKRYRQEQAGLRPEEIKTCPFCSGENMQLLEEELSIASSKNKNIVFHFAHHWYYKCPDCKECFTTTQSDDISMASMKRKEA